MDKPSYVITLTSVGELLVNGSPAAPTDGEVHTSETLLLWALGQVKQQWEHHGRTADDGNVLTLTIDDQRPGGYGRHKTRLRPGQAASIEALRARTGRNLSSREFETSTPTLPSSVDSAAQSSPEPAASSSEESQSESDRSDRDEGDAADGSGATAATNGSPPRAVEAPAIHPMPHATTAEPALDADGTFRSGMPQPGQHATGNATSPPMHFSREERSEAANVAKPQESPHEIRPNIGPQATLNAETVPKSEALAVTIDDEAPPHPGWTRCTPKVRRPQMSTSEKAPKRQKRTMSMGRIVLIVVATLVVAFAGGAVWNRVQTQESYVAVCVDQRTTARVQTDAPCKGTSPSYYRWWYVGAGSSVPAVGATVNTQQGSFLKPGDDASVSYGYAANGGVFKVSSS